MLALLLCALLWLVAFVVVSFLGGVSEVVRLVARRLRRVDEKEAEVAALRQRALERWHVALR